MKHYGFISILFMAFSWISWIVFAQGNSFTIVTAQQNSNIRASASTNATLIGALNRGETAVMIGENPNGESVSGVSLWYQVQLANGIEGWLWSGAVSVAQVTPTPSPTPRPTLAPNPNYHPLATTNLSALRIQEEWGRGIVSAITWSSDSRKLFVFSTSGLWFYDINQLEAGVQFWGALRVGVGERLMQLNFIGDTPNLYYVYYMGTIESWVLQAVNVDSREQSPRLTLPMIFDTSCRFRPCSLSGQIQVSPDGRIVIADNQTLRWITPSYGDDNSIIAFEESGTFNLPFSARSISFSPDEARFFVNGDNQFAIYSYPEMTLLGTQTSGNAELFTTDSRQILGIASAGFNHVLNFYDVENASLIRTTNVRFGFTDAEMHPNGLWLSTSYRLLPRAIVHFDLQNIEQTTELASSVNYSDITYSPDGALLASLSQRDGVLTLWDANSNESILTDRFSPDSSTIHFNQQGDSLIIRTPSELNVYDLEGNLVRGIPLPQWHLFREAVLDITRERVWMVGSVAVGTGWETAEQLIDWNGQALADEERSTTLISGGIASARSTAYAFHPNGHTLLVGQYNGTIRIYNTSTNQPQQTTLIYHGGSNIDAIEYSADGRFFMSASRDGSIMVWSAEGREITTLRPPQDPNRYIRNFAIHPDGSRVYMFEGSKLYAWDIPSGNPHWQVEVPPNLIHIRINDEGSLLAVSGSENVSLYNAENGNLLRRLSNPGTIDNMLFSPDGALLITSNRLDGIIRYWGVAREISPTATPIPSLSMPPTATLSPSPTLPPTPTATATPDLSILFQDDFEDGDLADWDLSFAGDAVEVISLDGNNVLHITGEQDDYISLGFLGDLNGANVLEARLQFLDLGTGDGSMNFNLMSENPGHGSGYSGLLSTGGGFLADRNGEFRGLESSNSRDFILELNQWYTVRFQLDDTLLNLLIDGQSVRLALVESRVNGEPVFIFDRGMEVYLDDVVVRRN